jgi:hypothetical protein
MFGDDTEDGGKLWLETIETPTVDESHGILSANEQIMNFFIYIRLTVPADGP